MNEMDTEKRLSAVLKAASDPTRRAILTVLTQQGETPVTNLASYFDMSLNAVSKHIKVLERAGLIKRSQRGRSHLISVALEPLSEVDQWFKNLRSIWDLRLDELEKLLNEDFSNE